jgi:radical SAM superfamily enzyme YgiQ (UPF0313 family)
VTKLTVKKVDPNILTVLGGPQASVVPVDFLNEAVNVDIAVISEGEYAMLDIADYAQGQKDLEEIQGIAYRKEGKIIADVNR